MAKALDAAGASVVRLAVKTNALTAVMKDKAAADRDVTTSTNIRATLLQKAAAEERSGSPQEEAASKRPQRRPPETPRPLRPGGRGERPWWVSPRQP